MMGQNRLEHVEDIAQKAKLKLAKISAELKALNAEIKSLQTEYSTTGDSKKIEKLAKRKQAANSKAEVINSFPGIVANILKLFVGKSDCFE